MQTKALRASALSRCAARGSGSGPPAPAHPAPRGSGAQTRVVAAAHWGADAAFAGHEDPPFISKGNF